MADQVETHVPDAGLDQDSETPSTAGLNSRSCISCHRRKVRCNRKLPCNHCSRAGWACKYPSKDRDLPKKASPLEEITDRLHRLETILLEVLNRDAAKEQEPLEKTIKRPFASAAQPIRTRSTQHDCWEALLKDGNRVHYVDNSNLLELFQDEDRIHPPKRQKVERATCSPSSNLDLNLYPSPIGVNTMTENTRVHPDAQFALKLWTIYVENVDPVVKVLHIPTTQSAMITMIADPKHADPSLEALAFAIYFSAITSLSDDQVSGITSECPKKLLQQYRTGLNRALTEANHLNEPNLTQLQALAIFATCLRVHDNSRAVWVLTGTAIRLAQSIGIHRDGASLKLSPFETELRLRLWWQLCMLDSRAPEDHGFALSIQYHDQDLRLPLNVDDGQIFPTMKSLPPDSDGWTDTSFSLCQIEAGRLLHQVLDAKSKNDPDTTKDIMNKRKIIQAHNDWLADKYFSHPATPATASLRKASEAHYYTACAKMEFMFQLREQLYVHASKDHSSGFLKGLAQEPFREACRTLRNSYELVSGRISMRYAWLFKTYTQWYALAYILRYLSAFPAAEEAEEAWELVDRTFSVVPYAQNLSTSDLTQANVEGSNIWRCLAFVRRQASEARAMVQSASSGELQNSSVTGRLNSEAGNAPSAGVQEREQNTLADPSSQVSNRHQGYYNESTTNTKEGEGASLMDNARGNFPDADMFWQNGFITFSESIMSEMLYLPEWGDIVNSNSGFNDG